ncbi:neuropeptide Y receptor type 5, partial [Biomphalaria pfeifferi]
MTKENYIELIIQFMTNNNITGELDFKEPFIKPSLRYVYPFFLFLHALVGLIGIAGNTAMLVVITKHRLYQDQTYFLMTNLAFADLIKCMIVLPITLANLLLQNWLFGSFLCFFLPMLQWFPAHASMLTFLMIAIDRYRIIVHPFKSRLPAGLCVTAVWVGSICLVLPYAIYIKYIDLGAFLGEEFKGVGICYVFVERRIEEYIRAMFVTLYAMPLAVIALLYVRVSAEFKSREFPLISVHFTQNLASGDQEQNARDNAKIGSWSSVDYLRSKALQPHEHKSSNSILLPTAMTTYPSRSAVSSQHCHPMSQEGNVASTRKSGPATSRDDDLDIEKEKRTQNYLITMTTCFAVCWCPLHILVLVHYFVHETNHNMGHYDITYLIFACFGFLATCSTPVLFASWRMSDATKDKLRGYFRLNNRWRSSTSSE